MHERERYEAKKREMNEQRERERQEITRKYEEEKKRQKEHDDALQQCWSCTVERCRNFGKYTNCPNYKPRKYF